MSFGKKTGRSAFFAVNGTEVVRLNQAPFNSDDFVCIGQSVPIRSGAISLCDADLYVSGAVVLHGLFTGCSLSSMADDVIHQCVAVLRTWDHRQFDDAAHEYFYEVDGQAALVTDVLARYGKIGCAGSKGVEAAIDDALLSASFTVVASDAPYTNRERRRFIRDFCYLRGIDHDTMTEFILELEMYNGVSATSRGSKLGIRYAPPGNKRPIMLFYFQISALHADLCACPDLTHRNLESGGFSPQLANDLFDFLLQFADMSQTPVPAGGGTVETLYLYPTPLFERSGELLEQIERFAKSL